MDFVMIGLLLREALDRLRVHSNMYLVIVITVLFLYCIFKLLFSYSPMTAVTGYRGRP